MARAFSLRVLPSARTKRWTARRKAAVVMAVGRGEITAGEAYDRYGLSEDEFRAWERGFAAEGLAGLRAGRQVRGHSRLRRLRSSAAPDASTLAAEP